MTRLIRLEADRGAPIPPEAAASLGEGGLVICPTDTLYALAADPLSDKGLSRLVAAKNRDRGKPIPLLLADTEAAGRWVRSIPDEAARLMRRFWPGALTIVLPAAPGVPPAITGGGGTVGLRVPGHPIPRALAKAGCGAITGTSANRGGDPGDWESPEEILREFSREVDWLLWEGPRRTMTASTVVRATGGAPALLREGSIPFRDIMEYLQKG